MDTEEALPPLPYRLQKCILKAFENEVIILKNTFYDEEAKEKSRGRIYVKVSDDLYKEETKSLFEHYYKSLIDMISKIDKNIKIRHDSYEKIIVVSNTKPKDGIKWK